MCVCVYMCTYFTAQGTDPFALRDGPQTRVLAVGVALVITLITKQHLERERERDNSINPNKKPHLPTYIRISLPVTYLLIIDIFMAFEAAGLILGWW